MVCIEVNDLLDEMMTENKRLVNELLFANNCLNLLNELKSYLQIIYAKYKTMIAEEDVKKWQTLQESVDTTVDEYNRCKQIQKKKKTEKDSDINQESSSGQRLQTSETSLSCSTTVTAVDPKPITIDNMDPLTSIASNGLYVCRYKYCGKEFKTRNRFQEHMSVHSQHKWPNTCHICHKKFKFNNLLRRHMKTHNRKKYLFISDDGNDDQQLDQSLLKLLKQNNFDDKQQRYLCPFPGCDHKYSVKIAMKNHFYENHYKPDYRPFVCELCGQGFKRNYMLKEHMNVHDVNRQKTYQCSECDKSFYKSYALKEHMLSKHSTEKSFKCGINSCEDKFQSVYQRNLHRLSVHQIKYSMKKIKDRYSCQWPGCDYRCAGRDRLADHTRVHTGERPFVCQWPECDKRFTTKKDLKKHVICHQNQKPFVCQWPGCDYRGNSSGNLSVHKKIHQRQQ
ncbi:zinc finger protein 425-like [Oppia nitens]|uniref:zinc finger protein 425-like n=1 Tax=Oppia nitens TaxID=1686743 RepID=UPI0023DB1D9D|nr:zinc finger protein 425-like [Oppia nitens]